MPINPKYLAHLESGKFYHIHNRAVAKNLLFFNNGNYAHFLKKYDEYFSEYSEVYAY
jgi:putative transposase